MVPASGSIIARRALEIAQIRMAQEAVLALQGPRAVGKSVLLHELALENGVNVVDLDDLATRDAVSADPAAFMDGPPPICVDEYQKVPAVLDAIKAELNRSLQAGRFVITGSTRHDALPHAAQSLTGRLHIMSVYPFSQGEIGGVRENLLDILLDDARASVMSGLPSRTTKSDYVSRIVAGGFPLAFTRDNVGRARWFDDYIRLCLERDVLDVKKIRQKAQLPKLLDRLAGQTAQVLNLAAAVSGMNMNAHTAESYTKLLEAVFLIVRVPAWGTTLRARAGSTPKVHVVDSGLAARLQRLSAEKLSRADATSLTELGHLMETFVVMELLKQASWLDTVAGYGHWRTRDGDEADLVIERTDGAIVGFEVKTAGRVAQKDLKGLRQLRESCGDAFLAGVALYTGERAYTMEDRLHVLPVDRLWTRVT